MNGLNSGALKTQNNDSTFDKFKPLYEAEKYIDPSRWVCV